MLSSRRSFLYASSLALVGVRLAPVWPSPHPAADSIHRRLGELEARSGGRIGAALFRPETAAIVGYRLDERFPLCSTFKVLAVAAVLARVDRGQESLQRSIPIGESDVLKYAPVTSQHVGPAGMSIAGLCEAAITLSDNTAANLLLQSLGGPDAVTVFARSLSDSYTRLDRTEPTLNEAAPGDPRDTTTPRAMAHDLCALLLGSALAGPSRLLLKEWMVHCQTGNKRIRSAVPVSFLVGDKTGSGDRNTSNDIAMIWPPNQPPFALTLYMTGVNTDASDLQAAMIAEAARACLSAADAAG
jgi:beta-lactamase class A